jgi:pilus assembly protein CpaB
MWKVKRMNTARIVVLAIAAGAGLTALHLASEVNGAPAPVAQPVAQLPTVDVLVAKSDIGLGQSIKPEDLPGRRGSTVNVVRYGIAGPTLQK